MGVFGFLIIFGRVDLSSLARAGPALAPGAVHEPRPGSQRTPTKKRNGVLALLGARSRKPPNRGTSAHNCTLVRGTRELPKNPQAGEEPGRKNDPHTAGIPNDHYSE